MATLKDATSKYRLPFNTTWEDLESRWSKVLRFDDRILVAGYYYNGPGQPSYYGAVYEFLDDVEEHDCESMIGIRAVSDVMFEDDGHAIFWAMMK